MAFVTTRGARFHTAQLGRGGPPVVMPHGLFTGSVASWYFTDLHVTAKDALATLLTELLDG